MSWSWRLVVTGVRLGTHYTFENLPGISAWTEDRQMKKSGWDEGREIERQEWETKKDIKSRTEWREAVREESLFKRKAQGREMRVRDLLVLKWLDMFLSVLISGCCGGAGGGGLRHTVISFTSNGQSSPFPSLHSIPQSSPIHFIRARYSAHISALKQPHELEKTKQEVDERVIHIPPFCFPSIPFLSFTHLHQPLSGVYWKRRDKEEREKKNKCQGRKKEQ